MREKMETIGEQLGELSICWQPWTSGWSCFLLATTRLCPTILENKDALALLSRYRVNLNDIGGNTLLLHLSEINRECKKAVGCCIVLWNWGSRWIKDTGGGSSHLDVAATHLQSVGFQLENDDDDPVVPLSLSPSREYRVLPPSDVRSLIGRGLQLPKVAQGYIHKPFYSMAQWIGCICQTTLCDTGFIHKPICCSMYLPYWHSS